MYRYIDPRTIAYPEANIVWRDYLNINRNNVEYLEIGRLHGGSLLMFHNMFGPNVHSTSIDPFVIVIIIHNILQNMKGTLR